MPTALVTGANRGIGLEFTRQYSSIGWKVLATARNPRRPTDLATLAAANKNIHVHDLDITSEDSILDLSTKLSGEPIDLLIHNSGIYPRKGTHIGELDYQAWRETMETNLFGAMKVTEALLPNVAASHRKQIAAISSTMGSIGVTSRESIQGSGAAYQYRASKAALNMAMVILSKELAPKGLSVVILCPGWVKTDMGGPSAAITPEQSVSGMRKILEKPAAEISGKFFSYDGAPRPW